MATVTNVIATYTKLRSGAWGIRVPGRAYVGQTYTVQKRNGARVIETVRAVVWRGNGISLCSITPTAATPRPAPAPRPAPPPVVDYQEPADLDYDRPPVPDDNVGWEDTYNPRESFDYDGFGNDITF